MIFEKCMYYNYELKLKSLKILNCGVNFFYDLLLRLNRNKP